MVHKHAASRLHYDLRLEHDGVLQSWAVPKGPGLRPGEKRLAVRVEDHPLEYGEFEGVIPRGEYGAGTVMLWDRGRWIAKRHDSDRLDFALEGQKLRGAWSLVRVSGHAAKDGDNWLLIKRREPAAGRNEDEQRTAPSGDDISVATGRTMEQIAAQRTHTGATGGEARSAPRTPDPGNLIATRRQPMPRYPQPQLATPAEVAPEGADWIHEIKFDGYRILARIENGQVRLISRNGLDWTNRFPEIAGLLEELPVHDALLDGEVVALGPDGISSFRLLQEALRAARSSRLVYQVFDLLHLNGFDLTNVALVERKTALDRLLEAADTGSARIRFTDHIAASGQAFFDHACRLGLEGIISKRVAAKYRAARSRDWLKVKCTRHQELLVGGYTDPGGLRTGFGALLLGGWRDDRLVYVGKVGTGFSERELHSLLAQLKKRAVKTSPFDPPPTGKGLHWVRPELIAEVRFSQWTGDGVLRHPTYRGLREDRDAAEIRLPREAAAQRDPAAATAPMIRRARDTASVAGVRLSHPNRVLYPQQGVTKFALAQFYADIADWILPQLAGRPLSLLRCPQGRQKQCFFQKHPQEALAGNIPRVEITANDGPATYLYVRTLADLVALVQVGTLELHVWGSRVDDVERPDSLVFDLDPAPDVAWSEVLRTAAALRERLAALRLESFARTTGGKGLHLVVPLVPCAGWAEAKAFARGVAHAQARDDRRRLTVNMAKAKRQGRIFLDYLRNGRGATAIASYSTRAREGAPVAVPVRWDELHPALTSERYTIGNLRRRLSALRADPWEGFDEARRPLDRRLLEAVGANDGRRA